MKSFIRIGVDLAKNFFQVHGIEVEGGAAVSRKLTRGKFREFFKRISPCRVGMEACGSAHYWGRELTAMGHEVVLIAPAYIKPYVKRGKNDAVDAAAICEAMSRSEMRFVPIKSADQQATLMLHKTRDQMVKQRTMNVNALRGHLAEFGLIAPKGIHRLDELLVLARAEGALPDEARWAVDVLTLHIQQLDTHIDRLEKDIVKAAAKSPTIRLLKEIPGVGPLIASAIAASYPDPGVFKSARDFSASLGLTPNQHCTGGKEKLGSITKMGNQYLRKMLVVGCTSVLRVTAKYKGALAEWILAMKARKPDRHAAVALANKIARTCWAIMSTGEHFREELYTRA
jgi:transposase